MGKAIPAPKSGPKGNKKAAVTVTDGRFLY
jgi:hypothetical protein